MRGILPRAAACAIVIGALVFPRTAAAQVGTNLGALEPNLATKAELVTVAGIDADLADAIIEGRPWLDNLALDKLLATKLDDARRAAVREKVWVPLNLNAASREEILLVPGVGDRMLREFLEYRPYAALAQFHREIGKYVDDDELARFEQYVYVPIDPNTASDEAILSIPGVGDRMLREFKEYRPWVSIAQFRREIGKYVSDEELARLERYVTIRRPS